jgi:hypothetical protein
MSVVSSPERMLFDRRARSKDLCASADTAIEKGDFGLAKRLLFQADIDDPRNRYAQERITWLEHHIEHFEKGASSISSTLPPCAAFRPS